MEPMTFEKPNKGYLESVKKITRKHGSLLIFDEIITGFRFDIGGAQKLFGVTPDIATFGKSMGNGFPISAIVGKKKFMMHMEEIFHQLWRRNNINNCSTCSYKENENETCN